MADENLKDFTVGWIITGLLLTSLITFTIGFMYNNNPLGLGDDGDYIFNKTQSDINSKLYEVETDSNELLNITSKTNPETSFLGSRDSVATSYSLKGTATSTWSRMKIFISWILVGDIGKMLLTVFGGIIGFISIYFITKWIRQGS